MRKPLPEFTKTNQFLLSSSKIESQKAVSSKEADSFFLSILRPGPCPDAVQRRDAGRSSQRAKSPLVAAATPPCGARNHRSDFRMTFSPPVAGRIACKSAKMSFFHQACVFRQVCKVRCHFIFDFSSVVFALAISVLSF